MAATESFGGQTGGEAGAAPPGGYLDSAVPFTHVRFRFDAASHEEYPDRGDFWYAESKWLGDPKARGPANPAKYINWQGYSTYFEYAPSRRASLFVEVPVDSIQFHGTASGFSSNPNTTGLADMNAGFKYAFVADPCEYFTFQFRAYIPTGAPDKGLGVGFVSIEPGFLYYKLCDNCFVLQGQLQGRFPLGGEEDWRSNVFEYGAGLGYLLYSTPRWSLTPIVETVGWTFVGGQKDNADDPMAISADGDTIVNIKAGARLSFGGTGMPPYNERCSLYAGWGHCVTHEALYRDILRVEYRIVF